MEPSEPFFAGEALLNLLNATLTWLLNDIFTPVNVVYTAMQIPAVVGAGFAAWWVHDFVYPVLEERIRRSSATDPWKEVLLTVASLIFPVLWATGLWLAMIGSIYFNWPFNLIRLAINLLTAWIAIRLVSILVRDPFWSRLIAMVAYTIVVLYVLHFLDPTTDFLNSLAITVGALRISMLTVITGMFSLGILLWVAMLLSRILERRIQRLPNLTPSIRVLIGKLFKASLITLAILVALTSIGIDLTALAVFGGALGVGIGFGLQKIVSNLISGVILLADRSIKPGDIILIGDKYGWVSSLGARYVSVETRDGTEYLIPNEDVITQQVVNWSHENDLARLKVQIRLPFTGDVDKALKLMAEAAARPARVLKTPKPNPLLLGFGENGFELEVRFWIRDVQNGIRNISSEVMLEIWKLFREHDIMIPFPRREIYIQSMPPITTTPGSQPGEAPVSHAQPPEMAPVRPAQTQQATK
jgi:small-conductance mechanosensitive channel